MSKRALYFGFGSGGHFLRDREEGWRSTLKPGDYGLPWTIGHLDGGLLKNGNVPDQPDGRVFYTGGGRPTFWWAFYWWDRSGDHRGASNSGFYVEGFGAGEEETAFAFACAQWPKVVARQLFPLVLQVRWWKPADGGSSGPPR